MKRKIIKRFSIRNSKKLLIFALILFAWSTIGVGYAYLSSNLRLAGTANIAKTSWNIHFSNIKFDEGNVEATTPAKIVNDTTISLDVSLESPGDKYSFNVDVVNSGTIDAMLTEIFKTELTEEQQKYIEYTIKYSDGNEIKEKDLLKKDSKETLKIEIKYKDGNNYAPNDINAKLSFTLNYVQDDGTGNGTRIKYDLGDHELGNEDWYKTLSLDFEILDDTKIAYAKYCVTTDGVCAAEKEITKTNNKYNIAFSNNKEYQIACFKAVDSKGNEYSRCSNKYKVDNEKPTISTVTIEPNDDTMTITVDAKDSFSGISKYYYSKDSGTTYVESEFPNYTFTSLDEGDYLTTVYVEDIAGNISEVTAKSTTIRHKSWCEKNNLTNFSDCIIATEQKNTNVTEAKQEIVNKGTPNFNVTSPAIKYNEIHATQTSTLSTSSYIYISQVTDTNTGYTFQESTGKYILKNASLVDPTTKDYSTGTYYTCGNTSTSCDTMYLLTKATSSINQTTQQVTYNLTKYNYTATVLGYDYSESGLYSTADDEGTSYYYRGMVGGNYVKFANKYWRIVRINGDNSVRLIYDGTTPHANGESSSNRQVGKSEFNSRWSDNAYVGYMYGDTSTNEVKEWTYEFTYSELSATAKYYFGTEYTLDKNNNEFKLGGTLEAMTLSEYNTKHANDKLYTIFSTSSTATSQRMNHVEKYVSPTSMNVKAVEYASPSLEIATSNTTNSTMKTYLENWYKNNLSSYSDKISTNSSFCNDREISTIKSGTYQNSGYGAVPTIYGYERFYSWGGRMTGPRLTCSNVNDKFTTANNTNGNKKLTSPIGLITADEVNMAGARTSYKNQLFYLYTGTNYWTMSPSHFSDYGIAYEFVVMSSGELSGWRGVYSGYGVRPVINLDSSNLQFTGSGTKEDPYVIE
ncbi:MAG: hypothetical protein SPJ74_07320 [Bacilli bacterium]|nr:hypothetical protein [Bacilli bacterium]